MIRIQEMLKGMRREPHWPALLDEQERILRFPTFACVDALHLGNAIVDLAHEMKKTVAVQIELDGATVFLCHMDGTTRFHDWFIAQKANVTRKTGVSSMRAFLNCIYKGCYEKERWYRCDGNFVLSGGTIPLMLQDGTGVGLVTVSGGTHEEDHQLAAEGMAQMLDVRIPSLL